MRSFITIIISLVFLGLQGQIEISTSIDLADINKNEETLSGNYLLMNDLTLEDWIPIGNVATPFLTSAMRHPKRFYVHENRLFKNEFDFFVFSQFHSILRDSFFQKFSSNRHDIELCRSVINIVRDMV